MPSRLRRSASRPLPTPMAYRAPTNAANSFSNSATGAPRMNWQFGSNRDNASWISAERDACCAGRLLNGTGGDMEAIESGVERRDSSTPVAPGFPKLVVRRKQADGDAERVAI